MLTAPSREALDNAQADGWTCVIVTNGRTAQQAAKIRCARLDQVVQGRVFSEKVGRKKPEAEIFHAAADAVGVSLTGAWVIGDSPHADVAGANALGLRSVWVSNGQPWAQDSYQSTHVAENVATAIAYVISAAGKGTTDPLRRLHKAKPVKFCRHLTRVRRNKCVFQKARWRRSRCSSPACLPACLPACAAKAPRWTGSSPGGAFALIR
ncbi:HAD family hydrolase [Streptomyces sp. KM273126]|uniref:HAD family hydrolase n=1 Tax=Streptomyces sp. KM273126 TaxID=2545247 RepID=UPI002691580C|nr:HAD family hydrolase [Streptomyces sp. KM273126]